MTGRQRRYLSLAIGAVGGLVVAVAIVGLLEGPGGGQGSDGVARSDVPAATVASPSAVSPDRPAVMALHDAPRAMPELRFDDASGKPLTLADFRGKVVLLNIWATWCGPCREEMPTLDRLQARRGGPDFEVVALSIDRAGIGVVTAFYAEIGIQHLAKYIDESAKAAGQLEAIGLPTTLLIDREGREIARYAGPAEWDAPEMVTFLEQQITRSSGASWRGDANTWADRALDAAVTDATRSSTRSEGRSS